MTTRMERPSRGRAPRVLSFAVFALLSLCLPGVAPAQWVTSGNNISNANTGNVGVGTAAPAEKLHVPVRARFGNLLVGESRPAGVEPSGETVESFGHLVLASTSGYDIKFGHTGAPPLMTLNSAGNLGVGTASPGVKLHVNGTTLSGITAGTPGDYIARSLVVTTRPLNDGVADIGFDTNSTYRGAFDFTGSTGNLQWWINSGGGWSSPLTITGGGNIGAGTASPAVKFQVNGTTLSGISAGTPGDYNARSLIVTTRPINDGIADIGFDTNSTYRGALDFAGSTGNLQWWTNSGGGWMNPLTITGGGNVGVGTAAPTTKLHVDGDIRVDGNINAKYQDVAEWVPSTQKLSAGTVVVLDPELPNHVLASTAPYDTAVAGVISERPGLSLGEAGEGKALVATTGRVKVRVDATRAAIKIGDLLVTSDVAGVAMKSEPVVVGGRRTHAPGTIIGKALEPFASGTGEILVLLSLQ